MPNGYFVLGQFPASRMPALTFRSGPVRPAPERTGTRGRALYIGHASDFLSPSGQDRHDRQPCSTPSSNGTDDPAPAKLMPLINAGQKIVNENATGSGTTQSSHSAARTAWADSAIPSRRTIRAISTPGGGQQLPG